MPTRPIAAINAAGAAAARGAENQESAGMPTMKVNWSNVRKGPGDFDQEGGKPERRRFTLDQIGFVGLEAVRQFYGGTLTASA